VLRVGDEHIAPGESRWLALKLDTDDPAGAAGNTALPVFAVAGAEGGPRVAVLGAPRGHEAAAALAATRACERYLPSQLKGSLTLVPALGLGAGRKASLGAPRWRFPGDPAGDRAARRAFRVFSALAVPADLVVLFAMPAGERRSALVARVAKGDARARAWALEAAAEAGAAAVVSSTPRPGTLGHALADVSGHLVTWSCFHGPAQLEPDVARFLAALDGLLHALGMRTADARPAESGRASGAHERVRWVRAPASGVLASCVAPGLIVPARAPIGEIVRLPRTTRGPRRPAPVRAPAGRARLVLEAAGRQLVRKGEKLALLVPAPRRTAAEKAASASGERNDRRAATSTVGEAAAPTREAQAQDKPPRRATASRAPAGKRASSTPETTPLPLAAGWVEWVSLPELGLRRVRAKLDTGARTSALHVVRHTRVGGTDARPVLALELPPGPRRGKSKSKSKKRPRVEARVRDWLDVRDTSGRTERRPVIETSLVLGPLVRRIRVTLTNRGDMRFPFLLGRTALGPHVVVNAHERNLIARGREEKDSTPTRES
jgi:predicted deacylase